MHQDTLTKVVAELDALLTGRFVGRISQLSPSSLAIDFGVRDAGYLLLSVAPADPRLHLIKRSTRSLQQSSLPPGPFAQALRSAVGGGHLTSIAKDADERVVRFSFSVNDELGDIHTRVLIAQLTGRSANLYLLDAGGLITHALRQPKGKGQQLGEIYQPPPPTGDAASQEVIPFEDTTSISEALDKHYQSEEKQDQLDALVKEISAKFRKGISRLKKLKTNLLKDLAGHGNPDDHKKLGDLLLANISTNERTADKVLLKDYYAEGEPTIEVEIEEGKSLQDAAAESFSRYGKAKRAIDEIGSRLVQIDEELQKLEAKQTRLEKAVVEGNEEELRILAEVKPAVVSRDKKKTPARLPGMRHYRSSDGYEVIVGRAARDNDTLTFRVARPNDLWLHAGDYPGSHVVVRNSSRKDIPHRTIIEAAQLAAKFSQAGEDSKVTVHYTQRKFLSKPKGAAPGLVRMSTFRSITVAPGENIERI
ncbi:MAG TPA: NFACT family protein [Pyrinomonadaceae bacterium]|nr:NFACT family protein [Pyrinomonadaceae bacterium]